MKVIHNAKITRVPQGTNRFSRHRELLLVGASALGNAGLLQLLPDRVFWGQSIAGMLPKDERADEAALSDLPAEPPTDEEDCAEAPASEAPESADPAEAPVETLHSIQAQACGITDDMSFGEAFAQARAELGAGAVFSWEGRLYNTYYKEEWEALGEDGQQAFLNSVDWRPLPEEVASVITFSDEDIDAAMSEWPEDSPGFDEDIAIGGDAGAEAEFIVLPEDPVLYDVAGEDGDTIRMGDIDGDGIVDALINMDTLQAVMDTDGLPGMDALGYIDPVTGEFIIEEGLADPLILQMPDAMPLTDDPINEDDLRYLADNPDFQPDTTDMSDLM